MDLITGLVSTRPLSTDFKHKGYLPENGREIFKSKIMTEESYQQGRKFMRSVNHIRGLITKAEGDVAKWTKIEDSHRRELRPSQADGAKKLLDKAMARLNVLRLQFDNMKFPDSNIIIARKRSVQCEGCGAAIAEGNTYCGECLCEDDSELM